MSDQLTIQFRIIRNKYQALITPLRSHLIWEISLPLLFRTSFSQTSLVLEERAHRYYLHDNGSCNNTRAFHLPATAQLRYHQLRIQDHVHLIRRRYNEITLPQSKDGLVTGTQRLVHFLMATDQLLKDNL